MHFEDLRVPAYPHSHPQLVHNLPGSCTPRLHSLPQPIALLELPLQLATQFKCRPILGVQTVPGDQVHELEARSLLEPLA